MTPRRRIALLIVIMLIAVAVVESITFGILYKTAFDEERQRLTEITKSQARLIEAIARFDIGHNDYPEGPVEATLKKIRDAHSNYRGFGETGEFTLSRRENDKMVFVLNHRHFDLNNPKPVPWNSDLAEPMRMALSGRSGTIIGHDYRGVTVLAAYEPVDILNMGIVAKIDLSEIRAPFVKAGVISGVISVLAIIIGAGVFFRITNPLVKGLEETVENLQTALGEVRTLRGILPICSFCKNIRNDEGYWDQVEDYVHKRTDADFSHSICPTCLTKYYSDKSEDNW